MATVTAEMVREWRRLAEAATALDRRSWYGNAVPALCDALEAAWRERDAAKRLLEDLTPGGSEFHDSPERCAEFVRNRMAGVIEQVRRRMEAERERDALAAELAAVKAVPVVGLHDLSLRELIAAGYAISREKVERYRAGGPTRNGG